MRASEACFFETPRQKRRKQRKHKWQNLRQQPLPERKQRILSKPRVRIRMLQIQSIAIELADPRGSNHNAVRILERQDIQRSVYSIAERLIDTELVIKS